RRRDGAGRNRLCHSAVDSAVFCRWNGRCSRKKGYSMMYKGSPEFSHQQAEKIGVLITNLGTPDEATKSALRRYLKEFLWDPRVVEVPRLIWWFALNGVILNIRPARSAKSYATVFTDQGSPLMFHTVAQAKALTAEL